MLLIVLIDDFADIVCHRRRDVHFVQRRAVVVVHFDEQRNIVALWERSQRDRRSRQSLRELGVCAGCRRRGSGLFSASVTSALVVAVALVGAGGFPMGLV